MSGRSSRAKGGAGEREVVRLLKEHGWTDAKRTSDGYSQSDRGDIANGPKSVHWEIKRQERLNVPGALTQTVSDAGECLPVLVHRPSRHQWMATLPLTDLLALLQLRDAS